MTLLLALLLAFAGDDPAPPALVDGVAPVHPDGAEGVRVEFQVLVRVDEAGNVGEVTFPDDVPERFRGPTLDALDASLFQPAVDDGRPVPGDLRLTIVFEPGVVDNIEVVDIVGERDHEPIRAVSDVRVEVQEVQAVASTTAADVLTLAPGVLVTRTGGQAEPVQIFLRGFDARHGQDIALSVDGMPLNQVGNPHGHGLANLDPYIAETIQGLRVVEGPFDPAQGDFAVAGSASLRLGLAEPGLMLKGSWGSFATGRAVVGWRHPDREGFFAAGEVLTTRGYGDNRGALRGSVLGRAEGGNDETQWHVLAGGSLQSAESAGLVRRADVDAGRVDLYGTQDPHQGGSNAEGFIATGVEGERDDTTWSLHLSAAVRRMQLRTNYTGFLLDDRRPGESPHDQRGDLLEQTSLNRTFTLDGHLHQDFSGDGATSGGLSAGLYGRLDVVDANARRLRDLDLVPYRTEQDYHLDQGNIAAFVDGSVTGWDVLTVDAGLRVESFLYGLHDGCAARDRWFPGAEIDDVNCPDEDRTGARLRDAYVTAQGIGVAPRGSVRLALRGGNTLMTSVGRGIRSLEALALTNDEDAGFGGLTGAEVGWENHVVRDRFTALHRLAVFTTHVGRDLIFDEEAGANVLAGETWRWGATAESEVRVGGFTERTTIAWTHATFGDELPPSYTYYHSDRQPGMLIPYVPPWVVRADLSYTWRPGPLRVRYGLGADYIAPRPLPQSERSAAVFTIDLSAQVRWRGVELGIIAQNLLDRRYPLAEYNFASWFPSSSGSAYPTRVPSRQISPGPPLSVAASLTVWPGDLR
ncbi:MAG TPA: TonB-dependent receptor plug domain-containing protein [Myxococcota bacterium]|nr:TonB-dependent receptor plug domain-containing protein [Myxococcota bacterium]